MRQRIFDALAETSTLEDYLHGTGIFGFDRKLSLHKISNAYKNSWQ